MEAAIELFNVNGYSGTSVRDIANKAEANVALISYYFGSKQGLLEQLMANFLEGYLSLIEKQVDIAEKKQNHAYDCLLQAIWDVMVYQQENHHLARFIHREITLDSTLIRELMSTYLAKEKHLFETLVETGHKNDEIKSLPSPYFVLQLRGMMTMPFLHPQYIREVYHMKPHDRMFLDEYFSELAKWIASHFKEGVTFIEETYNMQEK